ncbi:hypothetical protein [Georgenia sp. Z1491]|uniref:hypothetical protein n=1 Tax=Georgenia sp. Z1491 TaxID=3416707 RepID=UPI003CF6DECD
MSTITGRAGGNIRHLQHRGTKGTGGTRADRASLLHESMRELDPEAAKIHAAINRNIVLEDTPLNVAMVNDTEGGFRRPTSTREVLDYGDERIDNVHRKWNDNSFETTLIVVHLPKTLCEEIPSYYPIVDKDTGEPALDDSGEPRTRSRWVARDRQEALRYFDEVVRYYSGSVLTGGQAAIHGYDVNFDESTPHIQIMADTLGPDPKHPGKLRVDASRMWGTHRDVTVDKVNRATGEPVIDTGTGEVEQVMEQAKAKMARYQEGLREHMHRLGYPVERDYDPERHLSGLGKVEYTETLDAKREVTERAHRVAAQVENFRSGVDDARTWIEGERAELDDRAGVLDRREAEIPRLRAQAVQEGRAEGMAAAEATIEAEVQERVEQALGPARAALQRQREQDEERVRRDRAAYEAAAAQFAALSARIQPVVDDWEQLNPQTKKGRSAQRNIDAIARMRSTATEIEAITSQDGPELGE